MKPIALGRAAAVSVLLGWSGTAAADPLNIVGTWQVKQTVVETTCSGTSVGDVSASQWTFSWKSGKYDAQVTGAETAYPKLVGDASTGEGAAVRLTAVSASRLPTGCAGQSLSSALVTLTPQDGVLRGRSVVVAAVARSTDLNANSSALALSNYQVEFAPCVVIRDFEGTRPGAAPASAMPF